MPESKQKGKTEQRNFHSSVVLSTIGQGVKLVVDYEQLRLEEDQATKDEGELTAAKRLIKRISENHKSLIDVIVYDAIGCNSEWINNCIEALLGLIFIASNKKIRYYGDKREQYSNLRNYAIKSIESSN